MAAAAAASSGSCRQPLVGKAGVKSFDEAVHTLFRIFGVEPCEGTADNSTLAIELQVRRCLQELLYQQESELRERRATEGVRRQELWRQARRVSQRRRQEALLRRAEAAEAESRSQSQALEERQRALEEREAALVERQGARGREEKRVTEENRAETLRLESWEARLRERERRLEAAAEAAEEEAPTAAPAAAAPAAAAPAAALPAAAFPAAAAPVVAAPPPELARHSPGSPAAAAPARARRFFTATASPSAYQPPADFGVAAAAQEGGAGAPGLLLVPPLPGGEGPEGSRRRKTSRKQIRDPGRSHEQRAHELFDMLDTNHDGVISRSEFGKEYGLSAAGFTPSAGRELFDRLDADGDGVVSRAEFVAGYAPAPAIGFVPPEPERVHCSPVRDVVEAQSEGCFEDVAGEDEASTKSRGSAAEPGAPPGTPATGSTRGFARQSSDSGDFSVPGVPMSASSTPSRPQNLLARLTAPFAAVRTPHAS